MDTGQPSQDYQKNWFLPQSLNCFLTTKITFANIVGDAALKSGAEPDKILAALGDDSRIGKKYT